MQLYFSSLKDFVKFLAMNCLEHNTPIFGGNINGYNESSSDEAVAAIEDAIWLAKRRAPKRGEKLESYRIELSQDRPSTNFYRLDLDIRFTRKA